MVDVERFRILLREERDRKLALLPALRRDITSVNAARLDSNVDDEHDPEGTTIAFELSQASALLEQSRASLLQIDAALARPGRGHLRNLRCMRHPDPRGPAGSQAVDGVLHRACLG
ncbi:DnaK suppressor protein [Arthrobacter sp. MW3 TE3886]